MYALVCSDLKVKYPDAYTRVLLSIYFNESYHKDIRTQALSLYRRYTRTIFSNQYVR